MLHAGKGFRGDLTASSIEFLSDAFEEIWDNACGENDLETPEDFIRHLHGSASGWNGGWLPDDFSTASLYKEVKVDGGTYRVTVIVSKKNKLQIDIRSWYEAE